VVANGCSEYKAGGLMAPTQSRDPFDQLRHLVAIATLWLFTNIGGACTIASTETLTLTISGKGRR